MKVFKINLITLLFITILILSCGFEKNKAPKAIKGGIDLSNWDFKKNGVVKLNGEWEFYWQKLLYPEDFKSQNRPELSGYINVPRSWQNFKIDNKKINSFGYATYRIIINLNETQKDLALNLYSIQTAYRLFINGKEISSIGIVGIDKNSFVSKVKPQIVTFYSESDKLEIIMQVSNFHNYRSGIIFPIILGDKKQLLDQLKNEGIMYYLLFGFMIMAALYNLGLFILRKKDKTSLFFSLFCIFITIRFIIYYEHYFFEYIIDNLSQEYIFKILFYTETFGSLSVFLYFYHLFNKENLKIVQRIVLYAFISYAIIITFTPASIYSYLSTYYHIIIILVILYILFISIKAIFNKREGAVLFLIAFLILAYTIIIEIIYLDFQNKPVLIMPIGLITFIIIQSLILSIKFSKAHLEVEKYSKELEGYSNKLEEKVIEKTKQLEKSLFENTCKKFNITKREREIIELIIDGNLNKEISDKLNISFNTVNNHIKNIFKKCNVKNRVELIKTFRKISF